MLIARRDSSVLGGVRLLPRLPPRPAVAAARNRGQRRVNRPELVEAHGYDTKYAMHALRLGYQGLELLEAGRVTLPMSERERSTVMAVRLGHRWTKCSRR
jgi:hypothetical protein